MSGVPDDERHGREHDRHGAAQPRPRQEDLVAPRHPEPRHRRHHRQRPGDEEQDEADDDRGDELLVEARRVGEQAEQHEQPDLGDPAERVGEALERHPVGQAHVAEHERREVRREEAGDVQGRADGIREHGERDDADREEGGRRARPRGAAPGRRASPRRPRRARHRRARPPACRSSTHHGSAVPPGTPWAAKATTRMTTGASLKPDSASSIPESRLGSGTLRSTAKTAAASVERDDGAHEQRDRPRQRQEARARPRRRRAPTRRPRAVESTAAGRDRVLDVGPRRRQAALGQDEHEGGVAEHAGDRRVVELDAGAGVAEGQADPEVDEQRRQARPDRQAHRRDGHEEHERPDEEHARQVVEVHGRRRDGSRVRSTAAPQVWGNPTIPARRRRGAVRDRGRAGLSSVRQRCARGARRAAGCAVGGGLGSSRVTVEARPSDRPAPRRPRRHGGGRRSGSWRSVWCGSRSRRPRASSRSRA